MIHITNSFYILLLTKSTLVVYNNIYIYINFNLLLNKIRDYESCFSALSD